jgi:hypothetical protein
MKSPFMHGTSNFNERVPLSVDDQLVQDLRDHVLCFDVVFDKTIQKGDQ